MGVKLCTSLTLVLLAALPSGVFAAASAALSQPSRDLGKALARGDCDSAIRLANADLTGNDAQAILLIGRMVAEGVCVQEDGAAATAYFSRAAAQGLPAAQLEYGVQLGLGAGADQSYEQAGDLCQKGGLAHQGGASLYSLGYACTLSGLVSRRLRESLPRGAFVPNSGVARVSFNPLSGVMQIRAMPRVTSQDDATTGTIIRKPIFDVQATVAKAWRDAMGAVPKPDAARLEDQGLELTLDLDPAVEGRKGKGAPGGPPLPNGVLLPGDVHPTTRPH